MPIARAELSDGSVLRFYVPEGTTPEERINIYAPAAIRKVEMGIDPLEPPETTLGGYVSEIGKGLASGAAGLIESAATGAAFLLPEEAEQAARQAIAERGAEVQRGLLPAAGYEDTVARKVAEAAGSTLPFLATGAFGGLGGLAGRAAFGAGVGLGGAAGAGEAARRAEAAGATEEQISEAAGLGIIPGLGETLVPFAVGKTIRAGVAARGLGKSLGEAPAGDALSRLRRVASAAGGEGLQEAAAEVAQNLIAQGVYDPETGTFTGTGESLGYGAGVGALIAALAELAIPGRPRGAVDTDVDLSEQELLALGRREEAAALPPPEAALEGEVLGPEAPLSLPQGAYMLPPPPTGDISAILVRPDGKAYPAKYAAAFEEAIAEEERLRTEAPQRELFNELMAGEKTAITNEDLDRLGITSVKLKKELPKLNLADPKDAQKAIETIVNYANNPTVKARYGASRTRVLGLLNMPILTRAEKAYAMQAVEEGVAPQQITIEEGIARDIRREEEDIAYAQRAEQLAEERAQDEARMRAAQRPEVPTAMGAALQAAEAKGREVPGQAQLEIPTIAPADAEATRAAEGRALDEQIALEQRAIEAAEAQPQEQVEMFGPRGGVLRPTRRAAPAAAPAAPAAPEAEPVEEVVGTEEAEAAAVAAEEGDVDADVVKAEAEAISQATPEAQAERSASREEDSTRIFDEVLSNPQGPVSKYFRSKKTLAEGIDALAADMSTGLNKENVAAQEWIKANLSIATRRDLSDTVRTMREAMGLPLPAASIAVSSQPLSQQIRAKLDAGDLRGAINELTQSTDRTISRVATAIQQGLGNTKVVMASNVVNAEGKAVAGLYDPKTDTITLNKDVDLKNHVLLHEAMHAVTSHEIAKNTPAAQQMRNLFESVKDRLDTAYGATNLDEFVAEAFSNPEFQAKLGRITPKGEKISLWSRFKNIVENIIRRFRGQPSKKIESARDKADMLVADLISPAPESRDATELYSATVEGEEKSTLDALGRFTKGKISAEDVAVAGEWFGTAGREARRGVMQFLPLNAIYTLAKDKYPKVATAAEGLFKLLQTKNGDRQKYLNMTKDTAKAVEDIVGKDKKVRSTLDEWAAESTLMRADPTKPRSDYKDDAAKLESWDAMNAMLKGMTPEQQKAVKDAYSMLRDSYARIYEELVLVMNTRLDQIEDSDVRKTLKDKLLTQLLQKESIEPYFPLYRKGKYWLFYQDAKGEVYKEAFESPFQRDKARVIIENTEGVNKATIETYTRDKTGNFGNVDAQFAFNLLADVRAKGISKDVENVILDSLFDIMPERSLVRAFKPRQGVLGFERDSLKVFRERMPNFTNQIVNLKHDLALSKASTDIQAAMNEYRGTPEYAGAEALNENLQGYINFARNPKIATWSKALKSAGFGMTLGFNVSSVIVNATNLPVVVLPYLGGRYGFTDTMKAMNNARKVFMGSGTKRRTETFTGEGEREVFEGPSLSNIDFDDPNLSPEIKKYKALKDLLEARGQSNISTTSENLDMENPANTAWTATNAYMGWMFHQGERFNRQVTAMTSYDLELAKRAKAKKGELTEQDYIEAAEQALEDTELTNSGAMAETAPRIAQNNMGNWMLMYKRFGISMYYLQFKMAKQAIARAKTPEERAEAKRQIVGLFASSALFAGIQGVPLYGAVAFIANNVFLDDEDEDFDSIAASFFGEGLYSGAINAIFDVDVAPRIGMTNLVYRSLPNREQESMILQAMEVLGGPIFGIASRMEDGATLIGEGEVGRGLERMLPSAISNGMKALRYGTEGATTMRGDPILEDINAWNVFAQLLGLAPAGYTKQLEVNARDKGLERRLNTKRTDLMRDYYMAAKEGDIDSANELLEEMIAFSERNPTAAITGDTLKRSMRQHRVTDEIARQLGGITATQRSMQRIIQRRAEDMGEE